MQNISIFEALNRLDEFAEDIGSAPRKRLRQFRELIKLLAEEAKNTPEEVLRSVLAKSGYKKALEDEDTAEAEGRLENLAELAGSMSDYEAEAEARGEAPTLDGFLERVSLVADSDTANEGPIEKDHPHDRPRREGPRVRARAPHGHGRRHVPVPEPGAALAGGDGRSAASPTSRSRARAITS